MTMTAAVARIGVLEHDYCIATWAGIFILIWRNETTMDGVRALNERWDDFIRTHPSGAGVITIVEPDAPFPEAHVREALANFMRRSSSSMKSSAVVHEGTGFRAAAVRGVVTGLTLLARQPFPHRIFATVPDGCRWLAGSLRETAPELAYDPDQLIEAIRELRQRIAVG